MDLKVLNLIEKAGTEIGSLEESSSFQSISFSDLKILAKSDQYAAIVLQALELNRDTELPLYDHQFKALCALAELKDVLLIFPCGSGKSRVMNNGPAVVKLGFAKLRNEGWLMDNLPSGDQPLCIISCPLSSIMEEKIRGQSESRMLSMFGNMSGDEAGHTLDDSVSFLYGHPEGFTTMLGKEVLESNEGRIYLYVADEVGFNIWGPDFRKLMTSVPGSLRVFSPSAPMLCLSATVGISEQEKVIGDLGMSNRKHMVIDSNPIRDHWLISKLKRPSNQTGFKDEGGLEEMLLNLYVGEFVADPTGCRKAVIFCKHEEDMIQVYSMIEEKLGSVYRDLKLRPWVQYHSSLGSRTLSWIHQRFDAADHHGIRLIISSYKLLMGVNLLDFDLAIFIR